MRNPPIPKSIKIGPHVYRVELRLVRDMEPDNIGTCYSDTQLIVIARHLPPAKKREVLLHEITHAVHDVVGVIGTSQTDEAWILVTIPTLLHVMQENPKLVEYLCQNSMRQSETS